jgi:DNA polymerase elongation subunit (family B)
MSDTLVFLDVECYIDYFLIYFKSNKKSQYFELHKNSKLDVAQINKIMERYTTVGFNSISYDLPMIYYALTGATNKQLKSFSDNIVNNNQDEAPWVKLDKYGVKVPKHWDHIDLMGSTHAIGKAPIRTVSLKMFGARKHTKVLQDLPIEPNSIIKESQHQLLRDYCLNDVNITIELWDEVKDRIKLVTGIGNKYGLDLRSKTDSQIAESLIRKEFNITSFKHEIDYEKIYKYSAPTFIKFKTEELNNFYNLVHETEFKFGENKKIKANNVFPKLNIENVKLNVGIGGLHSNERHRNVIPLYDEFLLDIDVSSYYPVIIINSGFYPELIGDKFLEWYKGKFVERMIAKKNNDILTSGTIKIILNGSFGKLGSVYSCLFAPNLLIGVTLTGQLSLLMLIEDILLNGFELVSANTDGITVKGKKSKREELEQLLLNWEKITSGELDRTDYKAIYNESVNSYIAILDKGIKRKGTYAIAGISKNPVTTICNEAVINYITNNIPVETTILDNKHDITKFLVVRKAIGGGMWRGEYLGKTIRWYYSFDGDRITQKTNGNQVATSEGAKPLMILHDIAPKDIDFKYYIDKSYKMLKQLGVKV